MQKKLKRALEGLGMSNDDNFKQAVLNANQEKGNLLQEELSKKSLIGIFIISFLLLFCGYEQSLSDKEESLMLLHLELAYSCAYYIISMFILQWILFKKWKYVVMYIGSIISFFLLARWRTWGLNCSEIEKYVIKYIGLLVCITVSIPILWQIFITWIHKSVFYGYIKSKIKKVQDEYDQVIKDIASQQYNKLPLRYNEIYMRISQTANCPTPQQALDDSLVEYKGVLYNDIRAIGLNVRLYKLFLSLCKHKCRFVLNCIRDFGVWIYHRKKSSLPNYATYAKKYEKLKKKNKNLKMQQFCQTVDISFDEFSRYYCKYCQSK